MNTSRGFAIYNHQMTLQWRAMLSLPLLWTDFSTDIWPVQAPCYLCCLRQLPSQFSFFSKILYPECKAIPRLAGAAFLQGACLYQGTAQFPLRQKLSYVIKKITSFLDFKFAELIESLGWVHKWWSVPSDNTSTVQRKQWHMDSVQVTYKTQKPVITKATVHLSILLR